VEFSSLATSRPEIFLQDLCAGQFYLYKLDHRRFISMPFSISLDFVVTVIL
jgi:hypothetical protein